MTRDPDEIREGIEQTQQELSADVDALTDKLSPQRAVHRQADRARTATAAMKERVTDATAQAGQLPDAARRGIEGNPIAAGLIAFGAGWLISSLLPVPGQDR